MRLWQPSSNMNNKTVMAGSTLERPLDWEGMTTWQKAFFDVPVVGLRSRTFRKFKQMVRLRTGDLAWQWESFSTAEFKTMSLMSDILAYEIGWPKSVFLPGDSFAALIWDGGDGLATTSALERIEKEFGMEKMQEQEWREWAEKTFGMVVQIISKEVDLRAAKSFL